MTPTYQQTDRSAQRTTIHNLSSRQSDRFWLLRLLFISANHNSAVNPLEQCYSTMTPQDNVKKLLLWIMFALTQMDQRMTNNEVHFLPPPKGEWSSDSQTAAIFGHHHHHHHHPLHKIEFIPTCSKKESRCFSRIVLPVIVSAISVDRLFFMPPPDT